MRRQCGKLRDARITSFRSGSEQSTRELVDELRQGNDIALDADFGNWVGDVTDVVDRCAQVDSSGELDDIAVESLVPEGAERLTLGKFLGSLEQFDVAWARRVAAARARGRVLRYRAIVTPRRIRVGLVAVDASSPMASLNGTDNQFIFTTMRHKKNPLVITGPGAGPAVTAGGILNDVLKLAGA